MGCAASVPFVPDEACFQLDASKSIDGSLTSGGTAVICQGRFLSPQADMEASGYYGNQITIRAGRGPEFEIKDHEGALRYVVKRRVVLPSRLASCAFFGPSGKKLCVMTRRVGATGKEAFDIYTTTPNSPGQEATKGQEEGAEGEDLFLFGAIEKKFMALKCTYRLYQDGNALPKDAAPVLTAKQCNNGQVKGWRPDIKVFDPAAAGAPVVGKAGEKGALTSPGYASEEARRQYVVECGKGMDLLSVVAIAHALDYWRADGLV